MLSGNYHTVIVQLACIYKQKSTAQVSVKLIAFSVKTS